MLFAVAVAWSMGLLQWGQQLNWDELEFFRATRWIAEGRVPFRDYWEHHLPLQWFLFAPVAALFSNGPGAEAVIALRWAQVPLWIGTLAIVMALMGRAGSSVEARWAALVLLFASLWFVRAALQYRVDVPGHLAYVAALWLMVTRRARWSSFAAGVLLSLAVLANMRLGPLVLITVTVMMFWRAAEERWGWNSDALWVAVGGATVAATFVLYLQMSGAMPGFIDGVVWYNVTSDRMVPDEASVFFVRLAAPILQRDIAGAAYLLAGAAGLVLAFRRIVRPGLIQIVALLAMASLATIAMLGVQYEYHFQTPAILLMPVAASAIDMLRPKIRTVLAVVAAVSLAINIVAFSADGLDYQDRAMAEIDRLTKKEDRVWDSTGYALRREPAYRYWFLPAGVRLMADAGLIEDYDFEQIAANPPAMVVFNWRTRYWMLGRPRLTQYVAHHYVPLYQNLWIPGMSAVVGPEPSRVTWTVPRSGRYDLHASELLAKHPWFTRPLDYGVMEGAELEIPLDRLPPASSLRWSVNGVVVNGSTLDLPAGATLEVVSMSPGRIGVMAIPHGIRTLSIMPEGQVIF